MAENKSLGKVGLVGRFRPLHIGASVMLEEICQNADEIIIGIGSAGPDFKYDLRNPFTPAEVREMIELVLSKKYSNYSIIEVPDFAHQEGYADGQRWTKEVLKLYGPLDYFVSGNEFTNALLEPHYAVLHPSTIIPKEKWVRCKGSIVRMAMARGENWQALVRPEIEEYLTHNGLVERFRKEFGLKTIETLLTKPDFEQPETLEEEAAHARERSARGYLCS